MAQMTMIQAITDALRCELKNDENVLVFGEDVGVNGGVFRATEGLQKAFNIAIIPFYVNKLTNCVSPVKFFEYASMGLPILSTKIREMTKYQCEAVRLIDSNNIIKECDNLLSSDMDLIRKKCNEIAMNNTWEKRVETIEKIF